MREIYELHEKNPSVYQSIQKITLWNFEYLLIFFNNQKEIKNKNCIFFID